MGRTKSAPKRRRLEETGDQDERSNAIQELLAAPPELVEAAAAAATRSKIMDWPALLQNNDVDNNPKKTNDGVESKVTDISDDSTPADQNKSLAPFHGLGQLQSLSPEHFQAFEALHEAIKQKAPVWTSWSGSSTDPRKRAFGFLPGTLGDKKEIRSKLDLSSPWQDEKSSSDERPRNERAMVLLDECDVPKTLDSALNALCKQLQYVLSGQPNLQEILSPGNLIAAQPNLHSGRHLLPSHVDHPLKDGFGVMIVTIAMKGNAQVFLTHTPKGKSIVELGGVLRCPEKSAYMLSGNSRNLCAHGILADEDSSQRESLNLRFGLHNHPHEVRPPASNDACSNDNPLGGQQIATQTIQIPASEVLEHWGGAI